MRQGAVASRLLVGVAAAIAVCAGARLARAEAAVEKWRGPLGFLRAVVVALDGTTLAHLDRSASPEALDVNRRDGCVAVPDRAESWQWNGTHHPERAVIRDQTAVYVARAFELPL